MVGGVPHLAFESADLPPGEGRARWQALVDAYDVSLPEGYAEEDFAVSSQSWLLGEVVITHGRLTPVQLTRASARMAADGRDTFTFGLVTRGHLEGDFDGRACELRPGQICVIDFSRPWRATTSNTEFILLLVPRQALMALVPRAGDLHGRRLDGATARIVTEHLLALVRHLDQASAADAPVLQRATVHMVAASLAALAPEPAEAPGGSPARVADRVRRYVEDHLAHANLSPGVLCATLGLSRPTLYRAFRASGGVSSYVQRRRLEAAHVRLSDAAETRSVAELALACGFLSHAHFSTAFRRRFGYAPRDAQRGPASPAGDGGLLDDAALQFRSWILELTARIDPNETRVKIHSPF